MTTFFCEGCKNEFVMDGTEEEAVAERDATFGETAAWGGDAAFAVVCDGCYRACLETLRQ